jgi:hypothetical protein
MRIAVFVGPTISVTDARATLDCTYLPPVKQGDVRRRVRNGIDAIGIIDGYFHSVRSVWHKEILWALSEGVHVYGSASIGALRAAELHSFGMVGVGRIFEMYRDGELEDDDEVAVIHAPAEQNHVVSSVAMVNLRATLTKALDDGILSPGAVQKLTLAAKSLYFPHRNWNILESLQLEQKEQFKQWLARGYVDQKREDAILMLQSLNQLQSANPGRKEVPFWFEHYPTFAKKR